MTDCQAPVPLTGFPEPSVCLCARWSCRIKRENIRYNGLHQAKMESYDNRCSRNSYWLSKQLHIKWVPRIISLIMQFSNTKGIFCMPALNIPPTKLWLPQGPHKMSLSINVPNYRTVRSYGLLSKGQSYHITSLSNFVILCGLKSVLTHWPLRDLNEIFKQVICKLISVIIDWRISCEINPRWMPQDLTDEKSTSEPMLIQIYVTTRRYQTTMS